MKSPIQNGKWSPNEASEKQAQEDFYRRISESVAGKKERPTLLTSATRRTSRRTVS